MAVVECPSCGQQLNVPDELAGKPVRCTKCAGTFTAAAPPGAAPPPRTRERFDAEDEEDERDRDRDEERERRSRSRGAPHRGGMIMAFGIISLVLFLMSIGAVAGIGPFGIPVSIIGLVLGILAWLWGSADIKKMNAGEMDKSGLGQTQAGYYCGMIGTVLHVLGMVCGCLILIVAVAFFGFALSTAARMPMPTAAPPRPLNPPPGTRKIFVVPAPRLSSYLPQRIDIGRR